jgi:glycosyltransferase involved in cell wall biosynthesis
MAYTKVSVLIPTRHRIERLRTLLESYARTTLGAEACSELVFRVDDDDDATQAFLSGHRMFVGPRHQGYKSMTTFFNDMLSVASGDVLMCGNDDMVFRSTHWALAILGAADKYPDGLFNFGVSTFNETHYPFSTVSRKAVDALGHIWDPRIYWGDIYLRDVMGTLERCFMLPHVQIDHDWMGFHPDALFLEADQNDIFRRDPTYWAGTHATAVQDAVARLKELR